MKLFFTLWNVQLQDEGYDIAIGEKFNNILNIKIIDKLNIFTSKIKTQFLHIKDNTYNIFCFVYNIVENIAFVEVQDLYFMIDLKDYKLQKNTYYGFIGEIYYDQWNYLCLSSEKLYDKHHKQFEINGFIKSISYDIAPLIKINDKHYTAVGVESKFDYQIEKSTKFGWGEENLFPKTSGIYLVEIEINSIYIERKKFAEVLNNVVLKKVIDKSKKKLNFLDRENYKESISYSILYLDEPYYDIGYWIPWEMYGKFKILDLDMLVFDEVLIDIFNKFDFFSGYDITNFTGENAKILYDEILKEKDLVNNLSEQKFREKYTFIFSSIQDKDDFLIEYKKEDEFKLIKNDINLIFDNISIYALKAYNENKSFTIVGI